MAVKARKAAQARPLTREEYSRLKQEVSRLIDLYGRGLVKAEINRRPVKQPKPLGRAKKWRRTHLFALWMIVSKSVARFDKNGINQACKYLEHSGGIFELVEEDGTLVERPIVLRHGRIHSLY